MDKKDLYQLLSRISLDDKQAFNQLFHAWYKSLVQFALQILFRKDLAEDVVTDVFARIWNRRHLLPSIENPEAYLYTAVRNGCIDQIKSQRKHVTPSTAEASTDPPGESDELRSILRDAVRALPEQRRLVFILVKEQGKSAVEVSRILDISVRTVENHLYKAIKTLAEVVSGYLGYDPQHRTAKKRKPGFLYFF